MTSAEHPLDSSDSTEHSVSAGVAVVSGGLAGAMIGQLVGGRLGAAIGAVVGGVAGVTMSKEASDTIHQTVEAAAQPVKEAIAPAVERVQAAAAQALDQVSPASPQPDVNEQYEQALQLSEQGKLSQAIAAFQAVIVQEPDSAEAHYNLGVVLGRQGFREQGIEEIEKSRDLCRLQNRTQEADSIDRILTKLTA